MNVNSKNLFIASNIPVLGAPGNLIPPLPESSLDSNSDSLCAFASFSACFLAAASAAFCCARLEARRSFIFIVVIFYLHHF